MTHDVVMPQLGLTMTEGSVSAWLKKPGDKIEKGEVLFSVETDKVEMEVEATASGYVAAEAVEPHQVVPVGTVIAVIVDSEAEIAAAAASIAGASAAVVVVAPEKQAEPETPSEKSVAEVRGAAQYPATPLAKRLAKELGVDLRDLKPATGSRIQAEDVKRAHEQAKTAPVESAKAHAATAKSAAAVAPVAVQLSPRRAALAERLTASFHGAPHFYLGMEVDATQLVDLRTRCVAAVQESEARITYTDFFLKAMARALAEQPGVNTFWQDGKILARQEIDLGFAAQTDQMLLVPVIRNVDSLTMLGVARERIRLADKARAGKLTLAEMEGGSATLSNLGAFAIDWFQAILNPPQSVIVATGRIAKRAVVRDDVLVARETVTISASIDHRVLDGVAGAKFLGRIKELLEQPALLML
jgi:pyruvate dehydrogenase E2 component (dihydrolipoamide acetyltransferase)